MQTNKKIGIWGYGITGKAAVQYLSAHNVSLCVLDKAALSSTDQEFLRAKKLNILPKNGCSTFSGSAIIFYQVPALICAHMLPTNRNG